MKTAPPKPKSSAICFGLGLVAKLIEWLLVCHLVSLLITVIILVFKGQSHGLMYLQELFNDQLNWINTIGVHLSFGQALLNKVLQWVQVIQAVAVNLINLNNFPATVHYVALKQAAAIVCPLLVAYGLALFVTLELTLLRITTVLLFVPFFLLLSGVALIEGLIQRYLRRINGGRESTLIYHHARNAVLPVLLLSSGLYVVLPFNFSPLFLLLPGAMLFANCLFLAVKTFKKYF